ncbi:MAG: LysR family transcriptional regulator [Oceanobacter sp.]
MTLQQLELVLAIADSGSVHGACSILHKTQPTLTKSLKQLEEEMGVPIFIRSSRGMTPTALGLQVLSRARIICAESIRLKEDIAQTLGEMSGRVSVVVSPLVAYALMPAILTEYRKKWPEIELNISEAVYPEAFNRLRDGRVEMSVGPRPDQSSREFNEEALFPTRLVAVAKQGSRYLNGCSNEELSDAAWVVMSSQRGPGNHYNDIFRLNGVAPPRKVTWLDSFTAFVDFVQRSDSCCMFPEQLLKILPESLGLRAIEAFQDSPSVDICLFTRPDHPLTPAAEALARLVRMHGKHFLR